MLGVVLKAWRCHKELTLRVAAKNIGISYTALHRIERGYMMNGATLMKVLVWLMSSKSY